jgi:hypothetical protein
LGLSVLDFLDFGFEFVSEFLNSDFGFDRLIHSKSFNFSSSKMALAWTLGSSITPSLKAPVRPAGHPSGKEKGDLAGVE